MRKIAIQGGLGSFHAIAAEDYFGRDIELLECGRFSDIFKHIKEDPSVIGLMAIENTIAGSILPNYELLKSSGLRIAGEYKLRISHNLVALPGQKLEELREVQSHSMALLQCAEFLQALPKIKIVEHEDTALAARDVARNGALAMAAICSLRAAEIYGLEVYREAIETNSHNYTRFLIVAQPWVVDELQKDEVKNKASIVFTTAHSTGSLSQVLSLFSFYNINLTKIQSLPILGREWEYEFFVDVNFEDHTRFMQALHAIKPLTNELSILGEFTNGRTKE